MIDTIQPSAAPLTPPSVTRRVPRWPARYLALAAALLAAAAGGMLTAASPPAAGADRPTGVPAPAAIHDPPVIAVVQQRLELIGAKAGRVRRRLVGAVGSVSLSPNGRQIYAERTNGHLDPFPIDRIPATGGPIQRVATGEQPAISPDGTRLAYEAGNGHAVIVQALATGRRRTLNLASLIGPGASFNNTPNTLVWLSGHQLVAIPPEDGTLTSTTTTTAPAGTCSALYAQSRQCAIVLDLKASHPAHLVTLRLGKNFYLETAGPGPAAGQLLVGGLSYHAPNIERFAVTDTAARRTGGVTVPGDPLVVGFSPNGRHVLYLLGRGPVQLWVGRITPSKAEPTTELIGNARLGAISW